MPPFHADEAQPKRYTNAVDGCTYEITRDAKGEVTISQLPALASAQAKPTAEPASSPPRHVRGVDPSRPPLGRRHNYGEVDDPLRGGDGSYGCAFGARFEAATPRRDGGRGASALFPSADGAAARALLSPAAGPSPLAWPTPRADAADGARQHDPPRADVAGLQRSHSGGALDALDALGDRARAASAASPTSTHMIALTSGCPIASGRRLAYRDDDDFL